MESNITAPAYGASSGLVSTLNVFKYGRNENGNGKKSVVDIGEMTGNAYRQRRNDKYGSGVLSLYRIREVRMREEICTASPLRYLCR